MRGEHLKRPLQLVRHTRPAVDSSICYGRADIALAPSWPQDVQECVSRIERATRIISSPSLRCRALADAVGRRDNLAVVFDPHLQELDFGAWEGRPWNEIPRDEIDAWNGDLLGYAPGGGERFSSLWERVGAFRQEVCSKDGALVVISHHGVLRAFTAQLAGLPAHALFERSYAWGSVTCVEG